MKVIFTLEGITLLWIPDKLHLFHWCLYNNRILHACFIFLPSLVQLDISPVHCTHSWDIELKCWTLEDTIRIHVRACDILYILVLRNFMWLIICYIKWNDCALKSLRVIQTVAWVTDACVTKSSHPTVGLDCLQCRLQNDNNYYNHKPSQWNTNNTK